ncbi:MAG TPA: NAD(P)H-binding protein [Candidatus Acidoferrum sp.]|nr:NAD(P)H-binding protein [Candidatus Acidoferrum sp.]
MTTLEAVNGRVVVTGALGYTGKYITRRLLAMGKRVRTLTGHAERPNEFGSRIEIAPLDFNDPATLVANLRGADCLFNTYWVRFDHGRSTFERAVANTRMLFAAAKDAGVRKIVHISITNPSLDSRLPYFRGKAELERALQRSGLHYAILRPTVVFGREDILINNIAWLLRRLPLFAVPGDGEYRLQPVFVEDVSELAICAAWEEGDSIRDAVGPEIFSFNEIVGLIAQDVGSRARLLHVPPAAALALSRILGWLVRDRILTREEIEGLMAGLLVSSAPPTGRTRFSEWLGANAKALGASYASEIARHYAHG